MYSHLYIYICSISISTNYKTCNRKSVVCNLKSIIYSLLSMSTPVSVFIYVAVIRWAPNLDQVLDLGKILGVVGATGSTMVSPAPADYHVVKGGTLNHTREP